MQSSPLGAKSMRNGSSGQGRRGSGAFPKEMGMREMEDHISKINKQNFDLKLEVFHLRQRNEVLEGKVETLQALEADNEEMQAINEDLLLELETRDVAIQEAVGLICELEAKIEEMSDAEAYFARRSRTPGPDSTPPRDTIAVPVLQKSASMDPKTSVPAGGPDPTDQIASPPDEVQLQVVPRDTLSPPLPPKSPRRVPSFILDAKKSTNVLRSLYSGNGSQSHGNPSVISLARPDSVLSGDEDEDDWATQQMLNSPRLSVLSESGFSSIYNFKDNERTPGTLDSDRVRAKSPNNAAATSQSNQREARLHKWVEDRKQPVTSTQASPNPVFNDQFSSIGQILEKVPSAPESQKPREERSPKKYASDAVQAHPRRPSSPTFGGPIFGGGYLPPTPDTMSTLTVAGNSSTPSIITEKSLLDRPNTSGSGDYQSHLTNTLDFNARNAYGSSDDEQALPRQRGSTPSLKGEVAGHPQTSPHTGGFNEATRRLRANAPVVRPSLTTSATATGTATIFSSEAYTPSQASRTLSYPFPTGLSQRPSNHLSPTSSVTMTPTKRTPSERSQRSPIATQDPTTPVAFDSRNEVTPQLGRSSSLRSRMTAKMSKTPNNSTHQSVASRLFRRTTTQPAHNPPNEKAAPPSRPPVSRAPSNHARIPRPSSLYNGAQPISSPNYKLASLLPNEMLTDLERYSSSRNRQQ